MLAVYPYVSYEDLKSYRTVATTNEDARLSDMVQRASRVWEALTDHLFQPVLKTVYLDHPEEDASPARVAVWPSSQVLVYPGLREARALTLPEPLLEVTTLTTQNGDRTVAAAEYLLKRGSHYDFQPYSRIEIKRPNQGFTFNDTPQQANSVTGVWGYHEDWAGAWIASGDTVQDDPLSAGATSLTVTDADNFKAQQLLKIESEYLYASAKNTTTNVLTVQRGVNGTTAAAHVQGTAIYIYQPWGDVVYNVLLLANWMYEQKNWAGDSNDRAIVMPNGMVLLPRGVPKDITAAAERYKWWPWG